jgi:glycine/D-amino acid oxidase-like deaminating enzyme
MRPSTDVLVIGAGAFGAATAYHLARRGARVVVVERHAIASQTSPRAAGLAATVRNTDLMTDVASRAAAMLVEFEAETGQSLGIVRSGSLKLAREPEDVAVLQREVERGQRHGLGTTMLTADEACDLNPLIRADGVLAAMHVPTDLYFEPAQVAIGLAIAAGGHGAILRPETAVTGIIREGDHVQGVETERGPILAGVVVDAAGAWAGQVAAQAGVRVPLVPMRHQLLVTEPLPDVRDDLPMVRIIDAAVYVRPCWGGLLVGGYESEPMAIDLEALPASFEMRDTPLDLAVLRALIDKVGAQLPILMGAPVRAHRGGVPTMTVDGQHVVGPVPGVDGLFMAAGCNVAGLSVSPMIGLLLAEWILDGKPSLDLSPMAVDRFGVEWADEALVRQAALHHYTSFYRGTI